MPAAHFHDFHDSFYQREAEVEQLFREKGFSQYRNGRDKYLFKITLCRIFAER